MNGLEKEFKGALQCEILDATAPENKAQIKAYGFRSHGLVIFDNQDQVKKKMDGHRMDEPEIRAALAEVIQDLP
ncbi:MAG: hypothetical protein ACE5HO_13675 [bacterium]